MSFDALAPHYRWMEWLLAGSKLQRCRTAFLDQTRPARDVLLAGEGNGRFLTAFAQLNRTAQITVLDASAEMLRHAKRRAASTCGDAHCERIHYLHADVSTWTPPARQFDLIVTNFFFDCFRADQLDWLIPRLASFASDSAQWLVSDFCVPPRGLARWRARWIISSMYCFFRVATALPARSLAPIDGLLEASGFRLQGRRHSEWGLLHTDLWQRAR